MIIPSIYLSIPHTLSYTKWMPNLFSFRELRRCAESIRKPQSRDLNELVEFRQLLYEGSAQTGALCTRYIMEVEKGRERERGRKKKTDRWRARGTDRQTDRQKEKQADRLSCLTVLVLVLFM